jgi:hypothetical protein
MLQNLRPIGSYVTVFKRVVLLMTVIVCVSGCSDRRVPARGYLLGEGVGDNIGIAVTRLDTGEQEVLCRSDHGHLWRSPRWHPGMSHILCVDRPKNFYIGLLAPDTCESEVIYSAPANCDIGDVALTPNGTAVFVVFGRATSRKASLIAIDLSTRKSRTIAEADSFDFEIHPLSDKEIIVGRPVRAAKDRLVKEIIDGEAKTVAEPDWVDHLVKVSLDDGTATDLLELPRGGMFAVSPDGSSIFVCDQHDAFGVFDMMSRKFRDVKPIGLAGKVTEAASVCFISNSEVVLFRDKFDIWSPIGFYRLNINDGHASLLSTEHMEHPVFLNTAPFARGRGLEKK